MKKLELKFGSIKEMLTKEQMKQIKGGDYNSYTCYSINSDGSQGSAYTMVGDNACGAQSSCDNMAWSNTYTNLFPGGCDCPDAGDEC